jgi:mono/diheme cytochrome c family protein
MIRRFVLVLTVVVALASALEAVGTSQDKKPQEKPSSQGWTLPPDADTQKSPLTVDEQVLNTGKAVYKKNCTRCHGPAGLGDGPDADPDARDKMDLTNPKGADRNSDGVVFHKVWNGRRRPKMPSFKDEGLTEQQVWSVVAYVQTLRKK